MATFKRIAPVVLLAVAASIVSTAPAEAQPDCQISGGLGPNAACASLPEDDFSDLVPYLAPRRGFGGYGGYGGFYGDNTPPGISAGPG
ncbi:hypothetical protein BOO86_06080 [Mycobacterium sp. CBMA 234]|uniref:hypothetical protein n=1 Tax=Mycolicibacterium sp. CBMA 234 TaxID=1918495 RepID=UPI001EE4DF38|nr:hypothetical protein [Mycolicibacterium sp. CBMA 234]MUL64027.1 hypothetical protein [Mycolicibacterium sp. CBMA 234]